MRASGKLLDAAPAGGFPGSGFPPGEGAAAIGKNTHLHSPGGKRMCGDAGSADLPGFTGI